MINPEKDILGRSWQTIWVYDAASCGYMMVYECTCPVQTDRLGLPRPSFLTVFKCFLSRMCCRQGIQGTESLAAGCKGKLVRRYLHKNVWKRNGSEKRTPEKEVAQKRR